MKCKKKIDEKKNKIYAPLKDKWLVKTPEEEVENIKSAQSTNQTELGVANLKKIVFPFPPIKIQNRIANHISKHYCPTKIQNVNHCPSIFISSDSYRN